MGVELARGLSSLRCLDVPTCPCVGGSDCHVRPLYGRHVSCLSFPPLGVLGFCCGLVPQVLPFPPPLSVDIAGDLRGDHGGVHYHRLGAQARHGGESNHALECSGLLRGRWVMFVWQVGWVTDEDDGSEEHSREVQGRRRCWRSWSDAMLVSRSFRVPVDASRWGTPRREPSGVG